MPFLGDTKIDPHIKAEAHDNFIKDIYTLVKFLEHHEDDLLKQKDKIKGMLHEDFRQSRYERDHKLNKSMSLSAFKEGNSLAYSTRRELTKSMMCPLK